MKTSKNDIYDIIEFNTSDDARKLSLCSNLVKQFGDGCIRFNTHRVYVIVNDGVWYSRWLINNLVFGSMIFNYNMHEMHFRYQVARRTKEVVCAEFNK